MLAENWGLQSRLEPQLAKPFDDEFLGIEVYRFAGFALPAVDTIKERQRILIKDENMEPPSTFWIVFRTLDEPMVMLGQRPAEAIAEVVEHPLLGSTSFGHRPPVRRLAIGLHRKRLASLDFSYARGASGLRI